LTRVFIGLLDRYPKDIDIIFHRRGYYLSLTKHKLNYRCNYVNFYPSYPEVNNIDYLDEEDTTENDKLEWREFIEKCLK